MTEKILITSALPYANGALHFGHIAGAYLPADCYARFQRMQKKDTLYICGSDEYGFPITLSAELAGRSPQEHVNIYHELIKKLFAQLNFSFDHYSRTSWEGHVPFVHQFFNDLYANGYIEERITNQLFSEKDQRFLADRYVVGTCPRCGFPEARGDECLQCGASYEAVDLINPRSKITGAPLILKPTKHWFLLLEKFKDRLIAWLETKNWKPNVINFVKGYIDHLHARSITRDSSWGVNVPLPDSEGKVIYVWFDAPIGYISATAEWAKKIGKPDAWKEYWMDPQTKLVHFIGKDNIPFHAVIFPAMEMGQNLPYKKVDELPANEFYKLEGKQFSKSEGWLIDLEDFFSRYSADQIRYTIAANAPETSDSEFTWSDFQLRCNTDLLGKYGNLVNRVLMFAKMHCENRIPSAYDLEPIDQHFINQLDGLVEESWTAFNQFKLRRASQIVMEIAQAGNVYFDTKHPWKDAKNPEKRARMHTTIALCILCLQKLALVSYPIIPETALKVWKMVGYEDGLTCFSWEEAANKKPAEDKPLGEVSILFRKIEDDQIKEEMDKLHRLAKKKEEAPKSKTLLPLKEEITIDEINKLDLRVGIIKEAAIVPKSKKLVKLLVDIGLEERQIVAGISPFYKVEELIGKKVVVAANLKESTLMGVKSQGMVLAASDDSGLELIYSNLTPGSVVK